MSEERIEYLEGSVEDGDVARSPGLNCDDPADIEKYIDQEIRDLYEIYSYRHAAAILFNSCHDEFIQLLDALRTFRLTSKDIGSPGGSESQIPKSLSKLLRPQGWVEAKIQADLSVRMERYEEIEHAQGWRKVRLADSEPRLIPNFIDGHKIDYVKKRVAFDLEWNSKDQTFDRDLYAFRAFHECSLISAGVMLTRSASLNEVFARTQALDKNGNPVFHDSGHRSGEPKMILPKYGASTTWMGKLLYRLNAGRNGGCPVLAFGITPRLIE